MSIPFYVSPEQLMKDRADFARKGIARGRGLVAVQYADGIAFVSENLHRTLHKISELYDRIAFAAVGRYNEYENLRIAGVRLADMRGYSYDRRDVTGRGLANAYAQTLGTIFSSGAEKPYEVEIFVAEVGDSQDDDQIYRLTYQGSVADEHRYAVMGGTTERVEAYLSDHYREGLDLDAAVSLGVIALGHDTEATRTIPANEVEAAVLDRSRGRQRKFRRLSVAAIQRALDSGEPSPAAASEEAASEEAASEEAPSEQAPPEQAPSEEESGPAEEPSPADDASGDESSDGPPDAESSTE